MIRKNTWITLAVFAGVLIAALAIGRLRQDEAVPTPVPAPNPLWAVESTDIVGLTVEDLQAGTILQLERDPEDLWRIVLPESLPADPSRVERAMSWLAAPTPRAELLDELDLAAFELDEPHYRVEIVLASGERHEFEVGRQAPTGDSHYVSTPGRTGVQIMSIVGLNEVLTLANDILPTATPEPTATSTPAPVSEETPEATSEAGGSAP